MKYLFIQPCRYSLGHEITEFATAEELTAHVATNGAKDAILAQRVGVKLDICAWPSEQKEEEF